MSDPRETQNRDYCLPKNWEGGRKKDRENKAGGDSRLSRRSKRNKYLSPPTPLQSLTTLSRRFNTSAWGHCTGSTPEPTASFSKQCGILLTGLKSGTGHSGVRLGSLNTHIQQPTLPGQGPSYSLNHLSSECPHWSWRP